LIDAFQNPHGRISGAAGVETPPEEIARKSAVKCSPKTTKKFFYAVRGWKPEGRIHGRTEKPHGNNVKDETIKEGFQPPQNKKRKKNEVIRHETQAEGKDPDRNRKEQYETGKIAPPKENPRIGRLPNAAPARGKNAGLTGFTNFVDEAIRN
jgi:hypothetical protein